MCQNVDDFVNENPTYFLCPCTPQDSRSPSPDKKKATNYDVDYVEPMSLHNREGLNYHNVNNPRINFKKLDVGFFSWGIYFRSDSFFLA